MAIILSQTPYVDTNDTVQRILSVVQGKHGELSVVVREQVEDIVRFVDQRNKTSQIAAIYNWFKPRFTYLYDPIQVELVKTPERIVKEIQEKGKVCGDCDDATSFFLAAFRVIGIQCQPVRVAFHAPMGGTEGPYSHILVQALDQYGRHLIVDPVSSYKTPRMLGDARQVKIGV